MACLTLRPQRQAYRIGVRHPTRQGCKNCRLHLGGPIAIHQAQERHGDGAQVLPACTGLAHFDLHALLYDKGIGGQSQQSGLLLGEGLFDGEGLVLRAEAVVGLAHAPRIGLGVEVGQIGVAARGAYSGEHDR